MPPGYLTAWQPSSAFVTGGALVAAGQQPTPAPGVLPQANESKSAGEDCGTCGSASTCCPRWSMFGDILYIRPRNQEVAIAVPANGAVPPNPAPIQVGPTVIADFDYEPAFRLGSTMPFGECSLLRSTFTYLEATTNTYGATRPPNVMQPMITHPAVDLADRTFLEAAGRYLLDVELYDVDWVRVLSIGDYHQLDLVLGGRYAGLSQELRTSLIANVRDTVDTDVNFNGGGIRVGLEGEWHDTSRYWLLYARSAASFVAGEFRASYRQTNNLGQRLVDTSWEAGRLISMLDLEIGLGWHNARDTMRFTAGYMVSGWHNTVNTAQYIDAVQTNEYAGLGDFMTFDGFVGRAEFRF